MYSGFCGALEAFSKHSASGPCGVIIEWSVAPPGQKPSSFIKGFYMIYPLSSENSENSENS